MLSTLFFVEPGRSVGQVELVWETIDAVHERPPGRAWTRLPGAFPVDAGNNPVNYMDYVDEVVPGTQTQSTSSTDWFNCHVKVFQNGVQIGYATSGYAYPTNISYARDACSAFAEEHNLLPGLYWGTHDLWATTQMITVALFDMDGNRIWHRAYHGGQSFGLIQDREGNLVVTGELRDSRPLTSAQNVPAPWSNQPIYMDPTTGSQVDMVNTDCENAQGLLFVDKLDLSGNVLWSHTFTSPTVLDPGVDPRSFRTFGYSIVETNEEGAMGYRVAGYAQMDVDPLTTVQTRKKRPFIVDLDGQGYLNWKQVYPDFLVTGDGEAFYIARHPDPALERYVVTGTGRRLNSTNQSAWVMYFDENDAQIPAWTKDTFLDVSQFPDVLTNKNQLSTRINFMQEGPTTSIAWPVLANFFGNTFAAFNHEATGLLYKLDLNGDPVWSAPTDLGIMRGFEIHMSVIQTVDGDVAVASTKRPPPYSLTTPFTWNDVAASTKQCLVGTDPDPSVSDGYWDFDRDGPGPLVAFDWVSEFTVPNTGRLGNWLSESYVAKVDGSSGGLLWEYQWDESTTVTGCWPDNLRQRQCTFMLTEDADGSIVVCGNTGHSADDGYLAKIKDNCENNPELYTAFHAMHPYESDHVYTLPATTTTWSSSMNVEGSIVVSPGKTLIINNNAVISFADSRRIGYTTNIVVQPGGTLNVMGNALLTNIGPCGDGMWDGIKALGNPTVAQSPANQATVQVTSGAIIENAFVAVLAAEADINDPTTSPATQRGARVICTNATFRNNIYDVVLRPFNCGNGCANDFTVTNFSGCDFLTTGPLNYADRTPKTHLWVSGYPRLRVHGCTFDGTNTSLDVNNVAAWGKGIESFNTDLRINPINGRDPHFTSLESGCFAVNAPSAKPVWVTGAFFDGNGHSLGIVSSGNARVVDCDFKEPDLDMVGQGLGAPVYGTYLEETPVFIFENNAFLTSPGNNDFACVGSTFVEIGAASNTYRNNRYDGFDCLNCAGVESAGTTIQGSNGGLQFRCNQYSGTYPNAYDIAFTGGNVTVSPQQGSILPVVEPAGNTFALNCQPLSEQHFYNDGGPTGINLFTYYHHAPQPGVVQLDPTCMSTPLTTAINQNTNEPYNGCAGPQNLMMASAGDQSAAAANAAGEYALLKTVYDDWSDGGDAEGLKEFVADLGNSSYAIRNQLMLVAPKVSDEVWKEVFMRIEDMNPWHLAQALIANSPLEPPVLAMLENSSLMPYYKQMVANEQGGMSMQMIKQSELTYWRDQQTQALQAYTSRAYDEVPTVTYAEAIALHQQYPVEGSAEQVMLLHLANNDLTSARTCVNTALAADHTAWWEVQDMYLNQLENGLDTETLDPAQEAQLTAIAAGTGPGTGSAKAWLAALGEPLQANVVLPSMTRSFQQGQQTGTDDVDFENIGAFPNPSQGEAFLTYTLPEGMDAAELHVFDATGRIIWQQVTGRISGIAEIPTTLPAGLYQAVLRGNGVFVGSTKFTVVR